MISNKKEIMIIAQCSHVNIIDSESMEDLIWLCLGEIKSENGSVSLHRDLGEMAS